MYPMKIKSSNRFIEELKGCEYGRYEDALTYHHAALKAEGKEPDTWYGVPADYREPEYGTVFLDFSDRYKTQIELRNDEEVCELYYALGSGTIGLYSCAAANNMMDKIRERVVLINPEIVRQWPNQNGM